MALRCLSAQGRVESIAFAPRPRPLPVYRMVAMLVRHGCLCFSPRCEDSSDLLKNILVVPFSPHPLFCFARGTSAPFGHANPELSWMLSMSLPFRYRVQSWPRCGRTSSFQGATDIVDRRPASPDPCSTSNPFASLWPYDGLDITILDTYHDLRKASARSVFL